MPKRTRPVSLKTNPAVILQLVAAALGLLVAFGLRLSTAQTGAIMAVATIVASLFVRAAVTSPTTAARMQREKADAVKQAQLAKNRETDAAMSRRGALEKLASISTQYDATRAELAAVRSQLDAAQRANATPAKKAPAKKAAAKRPPAKT